MRLAWIAPSVACSVGLAASLAWATSTSTDTGGTTSSSTGMATSTGAGDTFGDDCGTCRDPGDPVAFTTPVDGAMLAPDAMVSFDVTFACSCDFCGCFEDFPDSVTLRVDMETVYTCSDRCARTHDVDLQLAPGSHVLRAEAEYSFHQEWAEVTVMVTGSPGTTGETTGGPPGETTGGPGGSGADGDGSGTGGGQADGDGGGCGGCRVTRGHGGPRGLGVLLVLGLVLRRRRS